MANNAQVQGKIPYVGITAILVLAAVGATWIYADTAARTAADLNRLLAAQGNVQQAGSPVGWAAGAKILPADPTLVHFEQISSARKLMLKYPVEYSGYALRIVQVKQVQYSGDEPGDKRSGSKPDVTLLEVVAKIDRSP